MQLVDPRPRRPIPIRITPLIDVVFILLVFFMLTSRLLPVDFLELSNKTSDTSPTTGEPIPELRVLTDGRLEWKDQTLTLPEILPTLQANGIQEVNVSTAPETGLNHFTLTLSRLEDQGITAHWKRTPVSGSRP
ncbi:biopolymer transporter ExbD [Marinobacter sp. NP-4(2019)]|uniref:ExbD/TolR family protein n=1 Tax=Marinobacter sp. NP-4(2019) TaxID=2488665 RepID=UPI000FC3E24F|nr:biopolymer transporter ExbD [Marinobacter sp. NP-4(2019)]AZT82276.1 biopolymer transporter ExbD [Marinobacter sp. NP-4(2019)]